jgi:hypothetical protein
MNDITALVEKHGFPGRDLYDLPSSEKRFPDGAHYRNELSGVFTLKDMEEIASEQARTGLPVHRVVFGDVSRLTRSELHELARISRDSKIEVLVQPGMLCKSDIGRHFETKHGSHSGFRVRGADNLSYLVASVYRCIDAGLRGFLMFDDGPLYLLNKMRDEGDVPSDVVLKVSYTAGHTNPASVALMESIGADSINPITDMELPMLAALRRVLTIPMDIVVFGWATLGKIDRLYHAPEIARVSAPCYLKQELYDSSSSKVRYSETVREIMDMVHPELSVSAQGVGDLRVGVV